LHFSVLRLGNGRWLILLAGVAALVLVCHWQEPAGVAAALQGGFDVSFIPGSRDDAGRFMGGTEMRVLTTHAGKLYAGNGYWEDQPGAEGLQGAEILVLDAPVARWRVDHVFDEQLPDGRRRDLAVSALDEVSVGTDGNGARLPAPVAMLIAANWDLSDASRVFSRDDATGAWTAATIAQDRPAPNFLPQVRSFGQHRDRVTGIDRAFAGQDPRGVYSGTYDPSTPGRIRWSAAPELDLSSVSSAGISGRNGYLRVSSFAECNGQLYTAVGQHIYERIDGAEPHWRLFLRKRRSSDRARRHQCAADTCGNLPKRPPRSRRLVLGAALQRALRLKASSPIRSASPSAGSRTFAMLL
jgi:hypothetical protein